MAADCLITGASGFIGSDLLAHCQASGLAVTALGRSPRAAQDCPWQRWDLMDPEVPALPAATTLFHLAGIAHREAAPELHEQANERAVIGLANAAAAAGIRRFVFVSSIKAGAAVDPYGSAKARAEQALAEIAESTSMTVVCVRPALVYGPGVRGNLQLLARAMDRGLPAPPERGGRPLVSRADLVRFLLSLHSAPSLPAYSVVTVHDGEVYSARRLCLALRQAAGRTGAGLQLPLPIWRAAAGLADRRARRPVGTSADRLFATEPVPSLEPAEALGWQAEDRFESVASALLLASRQEA